MTSTPATTNRVVEAARDLALEIEVREFPEGTRTAEEAARAVGAEIGQIVKSLVFMADGRPVVCLVSGANRLNTGKLAAVTGAGVVSRADADAVREATGYAVGGVPPFGHREILPIFFDGDLLQHEVVWAAAGTPKAVFAVAPQKLLDACGAEVVDLREEE
jgi:Cys-tRNA(Pro) deacylase